MGKQNQQLNRWLWVCRVWFGLLILLAACGQPTADPAETDPDTPVPTLTATPTATPIVPTPEYVDAPVSVATPPAETDLITLDIGLLDSVSRVDPQQPLNSSETTLVENLFVGLTRYNQQTDAIEPLLASDWQVSDDGRVWTFDLRQDLFWVEPVATGSLIPLLAETQELQEVRTVRQVVADDIVYAVQRACDPAVETPDAFILFLITGCENVHTQSSPTPADLDQIGIKANGPFQLIVTLTEPANHFLAITTLPLMRAVPRDIIAETDFGVEWADVAELGVFSGPFALSPASNLEEDRLVLARNPFWPYPFTYDDLNAPDMVNLFFYESGLEAFDAWQERELDVTALPPSEQEMMLDENETKVVLVPEQTVFYLGFNTNGGVFRDPAVRQAFSAAIDRTALIEEVYVNRGYPMRHFTPPGAVGAPGLEEVGLGYDPDYARQLLVEAGYRNCKFLPDMRYLISTSDTSLFQAEMIRDMWIEELDCEKRQIAIEQVSFGTLLANTRQEAGDLRPDIYDLGWASYYPDAHNWLSDVLHCVDSDNRPYRDCDETDQMMRRARTAEPAMRSDIYRRVEDEYFGRGGSQPIAPLFVRARYIVRQTWISLKPASFGGEQFDTYFIDAETKAIERQQ